MTIRVAILGGGLAGATLFRGLSRHSHLQVDIFESSPVFREQGQAIGTNSSGIAALDLLGLRHCIVDSGANKLNAFRPIIGHGPDMGTVLGSPDMGDHAVYVAHRAAFLEQILKDADTGRMHNDKKLTRIEQAGGEVTLFFEDGTTHTCDIAIGADGINSKTREYVVGDAAAAASVFAGWRVSWKLVPYDIAVTKLGRELVNPDDVVQWMWIGLNGCSMHDLTSNGTLVQCVLAKRLPEGSWNDADEHWNMVDADYVRDMVQGFDPRIAEGMVALSTVEGEKTPVLSMRHHKPIPSYVKGGVGIMGDAAGATTPWQGSGGSFAMEDAYLLTELFGKAQTVKEAKAALLGYDHVQRPRRHRLIESSYDTGLLVTGCHPEAGMDTEEIRKRVMPRWEWIIGVDLPRQRDIALEYMQKAAK